MKVFLKDLLRFIAFFLGVMLVLIVGTTFLARNLINFEIPAHKTILIVGDSRPESGLNDEILENTFNFSQSGTAYFYSYVKIRTMLEHNPHIDTIVLGFAYEDIAMPRDEWFRGPETIKFKMPKYLPLFGLQDLAALFQANPSEVTKNIHRTIVYNSAAILKFVISGQGSDHWGGYQYLERNKLEQAKDRLPSTIDEADLQPSQYQQKYLLEIYHLAQSRDVDLILLKTPIHEMKQAIENIYIDRFYSLVEEKMPEATIIDHSRVAIPDEGFGDLEHLNFKGAEIYSEYLKEHGFFP
jgi:hypothetical protein